jgi:hypothetical protein
MAESLSRLSNPRRSEPMAAEKKAPEGVDTGTGDSHHDAAESMHAAEPGSKHMIVSHDGYSYKSHGIDEQGKHDPEEGAHDHENIEELKGHLGKFFNEEEHEGDQDDDGGEEPEENQSLY